MRKCLFITMLATAFISTIHAQKFEVVAMHETGDIDKRINLVFLGDGYLEEDFNDFLGDTDRILRALFQASPFLEYKDYFNAYAIKVPSNERGAARDPSNLIDNYFGSTYNYAGIERLLVPTKREKIMDVLAENFPLYDEVFVLVNDHKFGGSGGFVATVSTGPNKRETAIHEIGHSMARLADEYWAGPQYARESINMTQETFPQRVKWKNWVGDNEVGIYPHSGDRGWYKPHENCRMQNSSNPFCSVCKEAFIKTIYQLTNSIDSVAVTKPTDSIEETLFTIQSKTPDPYSLENFWKLDSDTVARNVLSYKLDASTLSDGKYLLSFTSVDLTELSRADRIFRDIARWSLEVTNGVATYEYSFARQTIERVILVGGPITGIDDEFLREIELKTAPNPVTDRLRITFNNPAPGPFSMQLIDLNGKAIQTVSHDLLEQGEQEFLIDTSGLDQGMFLVQMAIGNKLVVKKILK